MIFTEYPNDFCHKRKIDNFGPYTVLLAIASDILVRHVTGFVIQGHKCITTEEICKPECNFPFS